MGEVLDNPLIYNKLFHEELGKFVKGVDGSPRDRIKLGAGLAFEGCRKYLTEESISCLLVMHSSSIMIDVFIRINCSIVGAHTWMFEAHQN